MSRIKDLTGQRSGKLVAVERAGHDSSGNILWRCACDCGKEKLATSGLLASGDIRSCGCAKSIHNLAGQRFGRLVAIERVGTNNQGKVIWKCICDCGTIKEVLASCLISTLAIRQHSKVSQTKC